MGLIKPINDFERKSILILSKIEKNDFYFYPKANLDQASDSLKLKFQQVDPEIHLIPITDITELISILEKRVQKESKPFYKAHYLKKGVWSGIFFLTLLLSIFLINRSDYSYPLTDTTITTTKTKTTIETVSLNKNILTPPIEELNRSDAESAPTSLIEKSATLSETISEFNWSEAFQTIIQLNELCQKQGHRLEKKKIIQKAKLIRLKLEELKIEPTTLEEQALITAFQESSALNNSACIN